MYFKNCNCELSDVDNVQAPGSCNRIGICTQDNYWEYYSTHLFTTRAIDIIGSHSRHNGDDNKTTSVFKSTTAPLFL